MGRKAGKAASNRMPAATRRRGRHPKTNRQRARPQRQPVEISGRRKAGRGTNPVSPSFWERARAQCVGGAPAFCVRARVRGSGSAGVCARARERERGSTPAFFVCARKRNARTRGRRSAPAVSCKWHETELSGGRYIGEAENGRKLNFPGLDPLDSMLSDSESTTSCPKSSHEQVEKLGKFEIVPKIRARLFGDSVSPKSCQPQTRKASGTPLALSARRAFAQRCRSNSMSHQHRRSDYLATRFLKSWAANSNKTAGQKSFRPDFVGLSESSTSPKQRRRRVTDFVRGCPHIATAPQQHLALPH